MSHLAWQWLEAGLLLIAGVCWITCLMDLKSTSCFLVAETATWGKEMLELCVKRSLDPVAFLKDPVVSWFTFLTLLVDE